MTAPERGLVRGKGKRARAWQSDAYDAIESIGELGFAVLMKARVIGSGDLRLMRRVDGKLVPVTRDPQPPLDDPEGEPVPPSSNDLLAIACDEEFKGSLGGKAALLRLFALHREVAGECHLAGVEGDDGWRVLSVEELQKGATTNEWELVPPQANGTQSSGSRTPLPAGSFVATWHEPAPRNSADAWSPLRPLLNNTIAEILDVQNSIRAIARSRTIADLVILASEVQFGSADEASDGDGDDFDDLSAEFGEHYGMPVEPDGDPLPPMILRMPHKFMRDGFKKVSLAREFDRFSLELRKDERDRLALGLDLPPEMLLGKKGLSHWMGWNLDEEFLVKHVTPGGDEGAAFFTWAYLQPRLLPDLGEEAAGEYLYVYDVSGIAVKPDLSGNAKDVHAAGALSDAALLRSTGFDEADGVTDEERRTRLLWATASAEPAALGLLAPLLGFDDAQCAVLAQLVELGTRNAGAGSEPSQTTGPDTATPDNSAPDGPTTDPTTADPGAPDQAAASVFRVVTPADLLAHLSRTS